VDGKLLFETFTVQADPDTPDDAVAEDELMNFWLELGEKNRVDR
jgi:hypothetical protein